MVPVMVAIIELGSEKSLRAVGRDTYIGLRVKGCARAVHVVHIFVFIIIFLQPNLY